MSSILILVPFPFLFAAIMNITSASSNVVKIILNVLVLVELIGAFAHQNGLPIGMSSGKKENGLENIEVGYVAWAVRAMAVLR